MLLPHMCTGGRNQHGLTKLIAFTLLNFRHQPDVSERLRSKVMIYHCLIEEAMSGTLSV